MKALTLAAAVLASVMALAAPAHADDNDPDKAFANQLHRYGIYGPRDYNAYLGKIVCRRLSTGLDPNAGASVRFISPNLARNSTQAQAWQFLGTAINTYCPDQRGVYESAAG